MIRNIEDPAQASKLLVDHALSRFSTDNLSCMVVRFDKVALAETQKDKAIGVEGDAVDSAGKVSEAEKIVSITKQKIADGTPAVGVSGSNSGRGHDPIPLGDNETFQPTMLKGPVDEAPEDSDVPEITKKNVPDPGSYLRPAPSEPSKDA